MKKTSAPLEYVEGLFDKYAQNFENDLIDNLEYKIPIGAKQIFKHSNGNSLGSLVDLGCGTGLMGMEVKHSVENLVGLDISAKMLGIASSKRYL